MHRAIELAESGRGKTSPNPMVGAVIVKNNRIVGEGFHKAAGQPHAEPEALREAGENAAGSTLYVNLEPCSHHGRTPPCAPAIADAGITRVVAGMKDPNPEVSGRGFEILEQRDVEVITGVLEEECLRLNEAFVKVMKTGLPFITLKAAASLDGKIATASGHSKWISSEESRETVHVMRGESDAVLVGLGTLLTDNPKLTSRLPEDRKIKDPLRVAFDPRLEIPVDSNFVNMAGDGKTVLITLENANTEKAEQLQEKGCSIIRVPEDKKGHPDAAEAMKKLAGRGVNSVLLEGGGELSFSMLQSGLIDRIVVFYAPVLIGGRNAKTFLEGEGFPSIPDSLRVNNIAILKNDSGDIVLTADISSQQ